MDIVIKRMHLENFKIFKKKTIEFSELTKIFAQNYQGKSSIADGFHWVISGKSSTGNAEGKQFHPRRYDEHGINIDHVDVIVELVLDIDGKETSIRKIQKQKWVRQHGSEEETYQGDTHEYYWNEVQVKESEHKKRVAEIIDEKVFRMITNPSAFVSQKESDQREFLTKKVAQITDDDVFATNEEFTELKSLKENNTLEELKAINKKALKGYKEKQETIPVRIDEVSKSIIDMDFAEHELALSALKEELRNIENKESDTSKAYEEVNKLKIEIEKYKGHISDIEQAEKDKLLKKKRELSSKFDNIKYDLMKKTQEKTTVSNDIDLLKEKISSSEIYLNVLKEQYMKEKSLEFDQSKNNCPTCGKEFDEDKRSELVKAFEEDKKRKMHEVNLSGAKVSKEIKENKESLEEFENQLERLEKEVKDLQEQNVVAETKIDDFSTEVDLSNNKEYIDLTNTLKALEFSLKETLESLKDTDVLKESLRAKKAEIQSQIEVVQGVLGTKQHIEDARDRVEELKEELRQATVSAANSERLLYLIEQFEKEKMNLLSEKINQKFKLVKWQLFRQQKNGGTDNVCIPIVNGSPYGENTTSTTERLMAGLDIINTLQEIYEVKAPIFIDNSEAYNSYNVPTMDCQMIMLFVSEDKEMRVEGVSHGK